jgi:phosphopantothenoylcysteine decarboxylase/phosphopantothenate--cysteine ligase
MSKACKRAFREADAAVMTAAVCDYRPVVRAAYKIPKFKGRRSISLEPTEDIAAALGRRKGNRLLVGFAMEDAGNPRVLAERKLRRKGCDLIVLNGPGNVGADDAVVEFFSPSEGWTGPFRGSKASVARRIVRLIEAVRACRTIRLTR